MDHPEIQRLKEEGNIAFRDGNLQTAIELYSTAINGKIEEGCETDVIVTLLSNRSMCHLKLLNYQECIDDCNRALIIDPKATKALYRRAHAYFESKDFSNAKSDLSRLLYIDPKNSPAMELLRKIQEVLDIQSRNQTEIKKILKYMETPSKFEHGLNCLIGMCSDENHHALDFGKQLGVNLLQKSLYQESLLSENDPHLATLILKMLTCCCLHKDFVMQFVDRDDLNNEIDVTNTENNKINLSFVSSLTKHVSHSIAQTALTLLITVIRSFPFYSLNSKPDYNTFDGKCNSSHLFISKTIGKILLTGIFNGLLSQEFEQRSYAFDCLSAFVSDFIDFFTHEKEFDTRFESIDERKRRKTDNTYCKFRSSNHSKWAVEIGILDQLVSMIDDATPLLRQRASTCLGRLIIALNDDELVKEKLKVYLPHGGGAIDLDDVTHDASAAVYNVSDFPPIDQCRRRAAIESSMFIAKPDLGVWALALPGGVQQVMLLISINDEVCQEIASEVLCLASSSDSGSGLLTSIVSAGILHQLMMSKSAGIRAAIASTLTKLSLKAKAFREDSSEIAEILNTVLSVLQSPDISNLQLSSTRNEDSASKAKLKNTVTTDKDKTKREDTIDFFASQHSKDDGRILTSIERSVEILAGLVGKTHIKEEILHGSYRVTPLIPSLILIAEQLDVRSTAAYGLCHIIASLTVTNHELKAKALADKGITTDQFEKMEELQRLHTKDENGDIIEEESARKDPDTDFLCRQRIKKLVALNVVPLLLRFLANGSDQTKDHAARALSQICVEESIRGAVIQQGLLKACNAEAMNNDSHKTCRLCAAHAIAKSLVTTNPNLIPGHTRLSCIGPLLYLCKESGSSDLQQFEALLSLTNIISSGEAEQDRLVHEKGIGIVHYLMFSENSMVRRAATEVFCNMPAHDEVLKVLRQTEKLRLWLAFAEDWDSEDNTEAFNTARAAAGTLAVATSDEEVCDAMLSEKCAIAIVKLFESGSPELVHRALVIVSNLCESGGKKLALHLFEGRVIPSMGAVAGLKIPELVELCKETAAILSKTMSS